MNNPHLNPTDSETKITNSIGKNSICTSNINSSSKNSITNYRCPHMSDAHLTSTDIVNIRANKLNLKDVSIDDTRKNTDPKIINQSPSNQSFINNNRLSH